MKALLLFCALLVACATAATSPVVALTDGTGATICSAFAVRPERLLTAAHCVPQDAVEVTFVRHAPIALGRENASVLRANRDDDWAVLLPATPVPVAFGLAQAADGAVSIVPAIDNWRSTDGTVLESYFAGLVDGVEVRRWSAAIDIAPGWSGSPLLQHGLAVGILQRCRGDAFPRKSCARPGFATFFPTESVTL